MSALDVLPREVLAKCLEFLTFDQAVESKQGRRLRLSPDYDWAADINQSLFILNSSQGGLLGCELFGSGLEAWADPELAADFVSGLVKRLEQETRVYLRIGDHERWTNHWQDRSKADKFMTAAAELLDREFIQHLQRVVNA